jgi:hypothetical protein
MYAEITETKMHYNTTGNTTGFLLVSVVAVVTVVLTAVNPVQIRSKQEAQQGAKHDHSVVKD